MKFIVQDFKAVAVESAPKLNFLRADTPQRIYEFYLQVVEADSGYEPEKEHVVAIALNTRMNVTGWHLVSVGSVSEATCHPREIFRPMIVRCAHSFVLVHNHPSGDPSPSRADELVTRRIKEAADLLKMDMADHVIVGLPAPGRKPYFSFRESGAI
jgi:DNA repair protein RadC